ncbi:MAG: DNA-protecting protein DprA [Erysipelotrichaceae bacterium]|nr:DNA-protecting protein DprA [Erysipelotrichaceae bacterium]
MDREKLISYSLFCGGEYDRILKAIRNDIEVPMMNVENAITIFDDEYPIKLLDLDHPPFVLYYKGDLGLLEDDPIAIVGSRQPCQYALRATECLARANMDKVIISGMAKGIDACAHRYAAKTIGILGNGIDYIYPNENRELYEKVSREGLLLSEYPYFVKPFPYHFPFRNRIIAALADTVYIMQSSQKSGTMTTVNEALNMGKTVRILPYDIFDECGINNNQLIYEGGEPIVVDEIAI